MSSTLDIKLNRIDRIFRPHEVVQGQVIISSPKGFAHQGIAMKVEGSARLQVSAKSAGLFDAFYSAVAPLQLVYLHIPIASAGKVPFGVTKIPFEFELVGNDDQPLFETYHGVYVSVKYEIVCDCVRGIMKSNLHKVMEFIVEVPLREPLCDAPEEFSITPETLENVRRVRSCLYVFTVWRRAFNVLIVAGIQSPVMGTAEKLDDDPGFPYHGSHPPHELPREPAFYRRSTTPLLSLCMQIVVEHASSPIKSVELQLIRVESVAHAEGVARDEFKVEFETNIVVLFEDGNMITENFPITLYR
ncbi:Down syndrome critical region protein 3, partial [Globisporangium splendens]